jgi:hypothetical protein
MTELASPHVPIPVTLRGLHRGRELHGDGTLTLTDDGLVLDRPGAATLRVRHAEMEGVAHDGGELHLFLAGGDVLEIAGSARLAAVERILVRRACFMPEFTRALRAVGTARVPQGAEHDRFFGPLLAARARAQRVEDFGARAAAFDAPTLRAGTEATLRAFAAERCADSPPDRRALEAELLELAEPLLLALDRLAVAGHGLATADESTRFVAWRLWLDAVRAVFLRADRWWADAQPVLAECAPPPAPTRWWRRGRGVR